MKPPRGQRLRPRRDSFWGRSDVCSECRKREVWCGLKVGSVNAGGFLRRETIEEAFQALGRKAVADQKIIEIAVYGGSARVLILPERPATKDVDAVIQNDPQWMRQAIAELAEQRGWPPTWFNDGIKGWLSERYADPAAKSLFKTYPSEDAPGLRVLTASPRYLFAMKCLATLLGGVDGAQDRSDIEALAKVIGVRTAKDGLEIVAQYYPRSPHVTQDAIRH
jgi:hypothetical protein